MFKNLALILMPLTLILGACQQTNSWGAGETLGTAGGAAAGGLVGNQIGKGSGNAAATLTGVLLGGFVGNRLGASVDDSDRAAAARAEQRAYTAPVGQQVTWKSDNGNAGTITPVRDGYIASGAYCREFQQTITIDGQQQQAYGKACQQPDGSWKIVQ
jgi:surface antigen